MPKQLLQNKIEDNRLNEVILRDTGAKLAEANEEKLMLMELVHIILL